MSQSWAIAFSKGANENPYSQMKCLKIIPMLAVGDWLFLGAYCPCSSNFKIANIIYIRLYELNPPEKGLFKFFKLKNFFKISAKVFIPGCSCSFCLIYLQH